MAAYSKAHFVSRATNYYTSALLATSQKSRSTSVTLPGRALGNPKLPKLDSPADAV
jgi:hypothetical protein